MFETIQTYYQSERNGTIVGGNIALVFLVLGLYFVLKYNEFLKGVGWPMLIIGAFVSIYCFFYFRNLESNQALYSALFQNQPEQFFLKESAHIANVIHSLRIVLRTELILVLVGALIVIVASFRNTPFLNGIGIALVIAFTCTAMLDFSNRERALAYKEKIVSQKS